MVSNLVTFLNTRSIFVSIVKLRAMSPADTVQCVCDRFYHEHQKPPDPAVVLHEIDSIRRLGTLSITTDEPWFQLIQPWISMLCDLYDSNSILYDITVQIQNGVGIHAISEAFHVQPYHVLAQWQWLVKMDENTPLVTRAKEIHAVTTAIRRDPCYPYLSTPFERDVRNTLQEHMTHLYILFTTMGRREINDCLVSLDVFDGLRSIILDSVEDTDPPDEPSVYAGCVIMSLVVLVVLGVLYYYRSQIRCMVRVL